MYEHVGSVININTILTIPSIIMIPADSTAPHPVVAKTAADVSVPLKMPATERPATALTTAMIVPTIAVVRDTTSVTV